PRGTTNNRLDRVLISSLEKGRRRRRASRQDEQSTRSGIDKQPRGGEEEEEEEEEKEEEEEGEEPRVSDATAQCSRPTLRTSRTLGGPYVDAGCCEAPLWQHLARWLPTLSPLCRTRES
ncbi:unnamed protein product, partial [Prorocentrum cordatum]